MKLELFSDLHLTQRRTFSGRNPINQLRLALHDVLEHHSDAAALILLGDLADNGLIDEYVILADTLKGFPLPVHLLLGDHDDRNNFHQVFGGSGFIQRTYSDGGKTYHDHIVKQGNKWLRWAFVEAVAPAIATDPQLREQYERLKPRGTNKAKVATPRTAHSSVVARTRRNVRPRHPDCPDESQAGQACRAAL